MATLDWIIVAAFICATLVIGLWFTRRASKSMSDYFVAGRHLPWWLAGTSMLATSFASDTPLHTTRNIRENGLAAAWFYWGSIAGGLIVAFVFSKLWRRAGVVTDNELIELRYQGRAAAVLRGGLAGFKAFFLEVLTMAWITLGMTKIVKTIVELPDFVPIFGIDVAAEIVVVAALLVICIGFSIASGFWGVVSTDLLEFSVAMTGAIVLAVLAMDAVGGVDGLRAGLAAKAPLGERALDFVPNLEGQGLTIFAFSVYLGVQWWANNQADGSGQRAQRFLSTKDDRNAVAAGVWNMAVQWLIRSWPWYVTALASLVLYPEMTDHEAVYPRMVKDLLPVGLKGLMVASFFAAFMGTMEAHYNMTASYATNDIYKRFIRKNESERHYVRASRWITLGVALLAGIAALLLPSVLGAFRFKMELVAGLGLIYLLRWMWWRINAVTEIVALLTSVSTALALYRIDATNGPTAHDSAVRLALVVAISSVVSIFVALFTKPEPEAHLVAFFRRVRPPRLLWRPIAELAGPVEASGFGPMTFVHILVAAIFVFSGMIGLGKLILGEPLLGATLLVVATGAGYATIRTILHEPKHRE
jgi:solute:Na+ symporter, SSS family